MPSDKKVQIGLQKKRNSSSVFQALISASHSAVFSAGLQSICQPVRFPGLNLWQLERLTRSVLSALNKFKMIVFLSCEFLLLKLLKEQWAFLDCVAYSFVSYEGWKSDPYVCAHFTFWKLWKAQKKPLIFYKREWHHLKLLIILPLFMTHTKRNKTSGFTKSS